MNDANLKNVIEAALLASGRPMTIDQLLDLFEPDAQPERAAIRNALKALEEDYAERGIELKEVASGFRIQIRTTMTDALRRLWLERPPRYSRALMETLALIAYRQPITRGEIEEIRGVSVSTNIMRTLLERMWVRVVGHRDVPGKPAMYATTRQFLDYFGLRKLEDLPPLSEIRDLDSLNVELDLGLPGDQPVVQVAARDPHEGPESDPAVNEYQFAEPLDGPIQPAAKETEPSVGGDIETIDDPSSTRPTRAIDT